MTTSELLHKRFNPDNGQIAPVRIKGFTRERLAMLLGELGLTRGAEVGVAEGIFSKVLCLHIPNIQLSCVDLWDVYYRTNTKTPLKTRSDQERCLALAHEKLDPYGATFIRKPSVEGSKEFEDNSLDFVYIDGDHGFDYVMQDLIVWSRKVRPGGIVAGHDYYRFRGAGVVNAVDAYTTAHQIYEWFLDDQRETTFFWAKP